MAQYRGTSLERVSCRCNLFSNSFYVVKVETFDTNK